MKRNELTILLSLAVAGIVAAFWLLVISPKRDEAASLKQDIDGLRSSLEQAQQAVAAGEQAREDFQVNYRRLVVLGKAAPADGDQAGLLVQVQRLADRAGVRFQSIELTQSASTSPTPSSSPEPSETSTSTTTETSSSGGGEEAATAAASSSTAPATEAVAATLPIGATVGAAGLPVMPYNLKFTGDFFQIASFLASLDAMVHVPRGGVDVTGRLLTVDGFGLAPQQNATGASLGGTPTLTASLAVTTYLTPADQGITAGATPGGPAPATPAPSTTTSTSPAPTSTVPVPTP